MFFYEGYACPVCGKPFQPDDDVVACPDCGAPHHRDCWKQEGHCHFAADHGTDREWSRETGKAAPVSPSPGPAPGIGCPQCGHHNPAFAEFCSHCGATLTTAEWHSASAPPPSDSPYNEYSPFRANAAYDGADPEEPVDESTVGELAAFAGVNAPYYIPRFRRFFRENTKCSWNWAAFFIPSYWLLYRKQYVAGIAALVMEILLTAANGYLLYGVLGLSATTDATVIADALANLIQQGTGNLLMMSMMLVSLGEILLRVLVGLAGNWLYYRTALSRIRKLKGEAPHTDAMDIAAVGGVSLMLGMVGYLLLNVASMLVQYAFL